MVGGNLNLANNCTAEPLAGMVLPGDVEEGKLTASGAVTVKPNDMELWRKMITGSASGTTPTGQMVYGSFEWNFTHSKNGHSLKVEATNVPFTCDFPSVDPNGGAAQLEFSFANIGVAAAAGTPVKFTLLNSTQSY